MYKKQFSNFLYVKNILCKTYIITRKMCSNSWFIQTKYLIELLMSTFFPSLQPLFYDVISMITTTTREVFLSCCSLKKKIFLWKIVILKDIQVIFLLWHLSSYGYRSNRCIFTRVLNMVLELIVEDYIICDTTLISQTI